jgi:C1A family cysteine protease
MLSVDGNALKESISKTGPVSVCVDASNWSAYKSGVFKNCGTTNLNHAVTAVGYEADGTWIIRNSWGASWGDQGHIRLSTGNTCGILNHAVVPNLA